MATALRIASAANLCIVLAIGVTLAGCGKSQSDAKTRGGSQFRGLSNKVTTAGVTGVTAARGASSTAGAEAKCGSDPSTGAGNIKGF
eukprot:9244747-Karenia_brevis.AAC.1